MDHVQITHKCGHVGLVPVVRRYSAALHACRACRHVAHEQYIAEAKAKKTARKAAQQRHYTTTAIATGNAKRAAAFQKFFTDRSNGAEAARALPMGIVIAMHKLPNGYWSGVIAPSTDQEIRLTAHSPAALSYELAKRLVEGGGVVPPEIAFT